MVLYPLINQKYKDGIPNLSKPTHIYNEMLDYTRGKLIKSIMHKILTINATQCNLKVKLNLIVARLHLQ